MSNYDETGGEHGWVMKEENDYDVVVETLQKEIDSLWKMTESNMKMGMMNIMDDIRLDQIDRLKSAIELWKNRKTIGELKNDSMCKMP